MGKNHNFFRRKKHDIRVVQRLVPNTSPLFEERRRSSQERGTLTPAPESNGVPGDYRVTESPLTSARYEVLDKQLAQARTKTRFIRSRRGITLSLSLSRGPNQHVRGSRRTNGGAKGGRRGVDRGGGRAPSWTREETTRWVRRNVEYESRSFSRQASPLSLSRTTLRRIPPR